MSLEFYKKYKVDIVHRLSLLEGVSATYMQTARLLAYEQEYNAEHGCSFRDYVVIRNIDLAFKYSFTEGYYKDVIIYLTELHELVVAGLLYNTLDIGVFRVKPIRITGTTYIPNTYTFEESLDWFYSELEKIDDYRGCVELYCKMMRRQLFVDGNKRTSYIFINYLLSSFGYFLLLPRESSHDTFLKYLKLYYEDEQQLKPLVDYLVRYYLVEVDIDGSSGISKS